MKARNSLEGDTKKKWQRFVASRDPELRRQLILDYVHLVSHVVHRMGYDGSPLSTKRIWSAMGFSA